MNLLVVSDTHGHADRLEEVMRRTHAGVLLFLGDGLRDLVVVPDGVVVRAVRGNCDFTFSNEHPISRLEVFGTTRIFLTHGHRYGVKSSLDAAIHEAVLQDADILLFGHTHQTFEHTLEQGTVIDGKALTKSLLIVNPGSLGEPRGGNPSFATLECRAEGIMAGFGEV